MGLFDDSKYVAERRIEERKEREAEAQEARKPKKEASEPEAPAPEAKPRPKTKPKSNGEEVVRDREGEVIEPSERAWLENVRAKLASITDVGELISYWEKQKPMATKVAESEHAAFATTAVGLARARIKTLREGGK
jgi:hypothetical protein